MRHLNRSLSFTLRVGLAVGLAGAMPVRADLIPDGQFACVGRSSGDACDAGTCQVKKCTRRDYEHWDGESDGGPAWIDYDCLLCTAGSADGGAGGEAGQRETASREGESGCGSCTATGRDLGLRSAVLSFALFMGLWLGGRRRGRRS